ncbi:hypothetical protein AYI69_g1490 [Smittium culicis]|uniref:Uncharacterized protein n=1 Tax=Smittium culicis TaxID=133412 RepID=A0A1R1YQ45_9FUNG|nr:hypothetical protein AYI69_g1490 [Smittium culicis]
MFACVKWVRRQVGTKKITNKHQSQQTPTPTPTPASNTLYGHLTLSLVTTLIILIASPPLKHPLMVNVNLIVLNFLSATKSHYYAQHSFFNSWLALQQNESPFYWYKLLVEKKKSGFFELYLY